MNSILKRFTLSSSTSTSPEIESLFLGARLELTATDKSRLKALITESFDWKKLVDLAVYHKIFPLIYWNFKHVLNERVPGDSMNLLQDHFMKNAIHNINAKEELIKILDEFDRRGIEILPIRGPILTFMLYDNIAWREFKDMDFLVREGDYEAAKAVFTALNYEELQLEEGEVKYSCDLRNTVTKSIVVELHWRLDTPFSPMSVTGDYYMDRAIPASVENIKTLVLPDDELFLMLCFHGARHRWHRLKWLVDLTEFIRLHPNIDWQKLLTEAKSRGIYRILLLNLWLLNRTFDTPLPNAVTNEVKKNPFIPLLGSYIRFWQFSQSDTGYIAQMRGFLYHLLIHEKREDRYKSMEEAFSNPHSSLMRFIARTPAIRRIFIGRSSPG